ncbi:hypothetical protein ACFYNL_39360 [Streptomyces sp. NPDC007808]|uniref:hypothetical protein n=1 Tax=Streptomyces sp. NPDC007808 TaxID=3364779 RepID=UPI0036C2B317
MSFRKPGSQAPSGYRRWVKDAAQWVYRRRHIVALNALRGISYAAGTSSVGLIAVWFQSRH